MLLSSLRAHISRISGAFGFAGIQHKRKSNVISMLIWHWHWHWLCFPAFFLPCGVSPPNCGKNKKNKANANANAKSKLRLHLAYVCAVVVCCPPRLLSPAMALRHEHSPLLRQPIRVTGDQQLVQAFIGHWDESHPKAPCHWDEIIPVDLFFCFFSLGGLPPPPMKKMRNTNPLV